MTAIADVTPAHVGVPGALTELRLVGDVSPVLKSTCVWAPGGPRAAGVIRAVEVAGKAKFGLGAAAFGTPPEHAVRHMGECVLIDGKPWWTPAALQTSSRCESPSLPLHTPFMFQWDSMTAAVATLRSADALRLDQWYEYLLRRLAELGVGETGAIAVQTIASMPARTISDKHLTRAPLSENRPRDRKLIVDEGHLDTYFLRNAAIRAYGRDTWCIASMLGVAINPAVAAAAFGPEFVQRGFYLTPGVAKESAIIHHTHALVAAWPGQELPGGGPVGTAERIGYITDELAAWGPGSLATHIESDTLLSHAQARIGIIGAVVMD
jgi:hypothetical protein